GELRRGWKFLVLHFPCRVAGSLKISNHLFSNSYGMAVNRTDAVVIGSPGFQYNRQWTDKTLVVGRGEHLNGWHSVHRVAADRRSAGQRLDVRGNGLEGVIARTDVRPGKEIVVARTGRRADHR